MATTPVLWQMMYIIQDCSTHLLIVSTVYEHGKQKTNVYKSTSSRWKNVNKMRHITVIADLNVAQKTIWHGDLSFYSAFFIPVYVSFILVKNCAFVMGFIILAIYV